MVKVNDEAALAAKLAYLRFDGGKRGEYDAAMDAAKLKSMARSVHRLDEVACGRELTTREETRRSNLLDAISRLAIEYGIGQVDHNSDPRGYAVYLHFPDGRGNSWGGDERGWGI